MSNVVGVPLLAAFIGGWETVLFAAVVLILLGAKRLPEIGGIHGKPAAQALTPDNQVAEFYDSGCVV